MEPADVAAVTGPARARQRAGEALRRRTNWIQLAKFCTVGALGYGINLAVYSVLVSQASLNYLVAATCSFLVAVTSNYTWNRVWTFRGQRGHFAYQGMRFFVVSGGAYATNLVALRLLVAFGLGKIVSQAIAIVLVTPLNFVGNKLWSFRDSRASAGSRRG